MLPVWEAVAWGLAGGLCVEALELYAHIRRVQKWSWRRPIKQGMAAFLVTLVIRGGLGSVLAAAAAASGQISGAFGALALGVAAPLILEKLAKQIPLTNSPDSTTNEITSTQPLEPMEAIAQPGEADGGPSAI